MLFLTKTCHVDGVAVSDVVCNVPVVAVSDIVCNVQVVAVSDVTCNILFVAVSDIVVQRRLRGVAISDIILPFVVFVFQTLGPAGQRDTVREHRRQPDKLTLLSSASSPTTTLMCIRLAASSAVTRVPLAVL